MRLIYLVIQVFREGDPTDPAQVKQIIAETHRDLVRAGFPDEGIEVLEISFQRWSGIDAMAITPPPEILAVIDHELATARPDDDDDESDEPITAYHDDDLRPEDLD